MIGTEKQINWAESIKTDIAEKIANTIAVIEGIEADTADKKAIKARAIAKLNTLATSKRAVDWIDARGEFADTGRAIAWAAA